MRGERSTLCWQNTIVSFVPCAISIGGKFSFTYVLEQAALASLKMLGDVIAHQHALRAVWFLMVQRYRIAVRQCHINSSVQIDNTAYLAAFLIDRPRQVFRSLRSCRQRKKPVRRKNLPSGTSAMDSACIPPHAHAENVPHFSHR